MARNKKKTKQTQNVNPTKKTNRANLPIGGTKKTEVASLPNLDAKIAWNFGRMDRNGDWCCDWKTLEGYHDRLIRQEGRSIRELFIRGQSNNNTSNHRMPKSKLCERAQNRLNKLKIEDEALHQIDLGTPVRLWGILEHNIFHVLWLDTNHQVYPMER